MSLFPGAGLLLFVEMDKLGQVQKTKYGMNMFLSWYNNTINWTELYPSIEYPHPVPRTWLWLNASSCTKWKHNCWQEKERSSCQKIYGLITLCLGVKHMTMKASHSRINDHVQQFNRTIKACLLYFGADHQTDWYQYLQPLMYACNAQSCQLKGMTSFTIIPSHQPASSEKQNPYTSISNDMMWLSEPVFLETPAQLAVCHTQPNSCPIQDYSGLPRTQPQTKLSNTHPHLAWDKSFST